MKIERERINEMLQIARILGPDRGCKYYPCHFDGQDCTWCSCPFYPCEDESTGGKWIKNVQTGERVWSCEDCEWIHKPDVAKLVLNELLRITKDINGLSRGSLAKTRLKIKRQSGHGIYK